MLVGALEGGIQHPVLIVVVGGQVFENALRDAAFAPSAQSPVYGLPVAEPLGKIAPRYPAR
jgi:hypothetical protein